MNKKILSTIAAMAAVAAILPGMQLDALNSAPTLTANAEWSEDGAMYLTDNGHYTGWHLIDGDYYFFDESGNKVTSSFIDWNDNTYYVDEEGHSITDNWIYNTDLDGYCYMDSVGKMVKNDWIYDENYGSYYYLGLDGKEEFGPELFDDSDGISTAVGYKTITQTKTVNGVDFTLTIDLNKWAQNTSPDQIKTIADLFWGCYPKMYNRFASVAGSKTNITIAVENEGYGIAEAGWYKVHIHDQWLKNNPTDYDCLTHELGHIIQFDWLTDNNGGYYCEYSDYVERFADYCRYVYAYNDGYYNDNGWTLHTKYGENTRASSNRFFVWLDYRFSSDDNDIIAKFVKVCSEAKYPRYNWSAAWAEIFTGSALEGKSIDEVWNMYTADSFSTAYARTSSFGGVSPLNSVYNVRAMLDR